jgi:hypothetical protein
MTRTLECRGWIRESQRRADLDGLTGRELLARAGELPGNARFARDESGVVQVWDTCDEFDQPDNYQQLDDERIEALLAEFSSAFAKREERWVVPPVEEHGVELAVESAADGVLVKAVLADTSDASAIALDALAEFLCRAHHGLRFVRAELSESQAYVIARAEAQRLESDLPHALRAVATAGRMLGREATALLQVELAEAYLKNVQAT